MIKKFDLQYRFLSNFHPVEVFYEGFAYRSVEHAYQASKFLDEKMRTAIRNTHDPSVAKKLGKSAGMRADFEQIKLSVMEDLVRQKFNNQEMKEHLLDTGDEVIVEGNYWGDRFWGVDLKTLKGENHLGKILMKIRDELRSK